MDACADRTWRNGISGGSQDRIKKAQYAPVMKFEREGDGCQVFRMTYRGEGGWSWPLAIGKLRELSKKFVRHINTEEFFELM